MMTSAHSPPPCAAAARRGGTGARSDERERESSRRDERKEEQENKGGQRGVPPRAMGRRLLCWAARHTPARSRAGAEEGGGGQSRAGAEEGGGGPDSTGRASGVQNVLSSADALHCPPDKTQRQPSDISADVSSVQQGWNSSNLG